MPIWVYIYCILLTGSAIYGIKILKAKPTYMLGAALFVIFCWLICIDYYVADLWIFKSQITFAIYMACATMWQAIEFKAVMAYMQSQDQKNIDALEAMQDEFGQTKNLLPIIMGTLFGIVFIFYLPILYMAFEIFIQIPPHSL